jgi:putative transposase
LAGRRLGADKKKAHDDSAHLVLIDESGLLMAPLVRRSQAPRGHPPILEQQGKHREKVSLIAALTVSPVRQHLGLYFQTFPNDYVDNTKAAAFLEQLLRHLRGKVIVVWDRGQMHRGPALRALLARYPRLTLESLPSYAPDLNPVEQLWNYLKYQQLANFAPRSVHLLHAVAAGELAAVQDDQARLRSFYEASELPFPEQVAFVS